MGSIEAQTQRFCDRLKIISAVKQLSSGASESVVFYGYLLVKMLDASSHYVRQLRLSSTEVSQLVVENQVPSWILTSRDSEE
ncbi:hypothetical protein V1478_015427 [Vespula squamosa]|uniref:Uncharacterized protein n=1 Tax=Vespula squamosa TaxID=30214 RepID=A0ABD2A524_VESSQ